MKLIGPVPAQGGCGYVDGCGETRIPFRYEALGSFHEGLAWFEDRGRIGFIDEQNNVIIPPRFERGHQAMVLSDFSSGLAPVQLGAHMGFIDTSGRFRIPCAFRFCSPYVGGIALVSRESEGFSVINRQGERLCRLDFSSVAEKPYEADCIKVYQLIDSETHPAFVDRFGVIVGGPFADLEEIFEFSRESPYLAAGILRRQRRVGFYDRSGNVRIPPVFTRTTGFSEGLAGVSTPEHVWGYIDSSGKWVIEPQFTWANPFFGGIATVSLGRRSGQRWHMIGRDAGRRSELRCDSVTAEFEDGFRVLVVGSSVLVTDPACTVIWSGKRV